MQHINKIEGTKFPKMILNYQTNVKKDVGKPKQRWKESEVEMVDKEDKQVHELCFRRIEKNN